MAVLLNILVVLLIDFCVFIGAIQDYCSENNFEDVGNGMHFTKEASNEEFAIVDKFKGLHCCAKGYKSIEWFKDDKPYPWSLDHSTLIIFPENANQTIYTPQIKSDDSGNYTCVLRNDEGNQTIIRTHTINLKVFDKLPDDPKITYISQDKEVYAGDQMRLFCEAFGGRIDLPDAYSVAEWHKLLSNGTTVEVNGSEKIKQQKSSREDGQTFGTYLTFSKVAADDYGTYICVIKKPGNTINKRVTITERVKVIKYINPNPFPLKEILIGSAVAILLITTALILFKQYGLKVQVILKDTYGSVEANDGKTSDILVAFASKDSELVLGVMVPNLQEKGYQCVAQELSADASEWHSELIEQAQSTRRVIAIISPSSISTWTSTSIYETLKRLQTLNGPKLICVTLKELPINQTEVKNSLGESLAILARSMTIIQWERCNNERFWLSLCKELPAKRGTVGHVSEQSNQRPRLSSERSCDNLMV